jgi:hypothetical protein
MDRLFRMILARHRKFLSHGRMALPRDKGALSRQYWPESSADPNSPQLETSRSGRVIRRMLSPR